MRKCNDVKGYKLIEGTSGEILAELVGNFPQGTVYPLADVPITLHFRTDGSVTDTGFRIYFYVDDRPPGAARSVDKFCRISSLTVTQSNVTLVKLY